MVAVVFVVGCFSQPSYPASRLKTMVLVCCLCSCAVCCNSNLECFDTRKPDNIRINIHTRTRTHSIYVT